MENNQAGLTLEQQFKLKTLEADLERMTLAQAKELLREYIKQGMLKDNLFKAWAKEDMSRWLS